MPVAFGAFPGPRQRPDGERWDCLNSPEKTTFWVRYRTSAAALERLLPPNFSLHGEPVISVEASYVRDIDWLAGRGYNMLGVTFPARYSGTRDEAHGNFLAVLWENLADPIISGREDLGYAKLYAEIPDLTLDESAGRATASAAWDGFTFCRLEVSDLQTQDVRDVAPSPPLLHFKYVPRTEDWGEADASYATMTPADTPNRRVLRRWQGTGAISFSRATFEQLPTLFHIVNALAELELLEVAGAGGLVTVGGKDFRDQRVLR